MPACAGMTVLQKFLSCCAAAPRHRPYWTRISYHGLFSDRSATENAAPVSRLVHGELEYSKPSLNRNSPRAAWSGSLSIQIVNLQQALNIEDLRCIAERRLPAIAYDFLERGTEDDVTRSEERRVGKECRL